jgi:hypothetical protein
VKERKSDFSWILCLKEGQKLDSIRLVRSWPWYQRFLFVCLFVCICVCLFDRGGKGKRERLDEGIDRQTSRRRARRIDEQRVDERVPPSLYSVLLPHQHRCCYCGCCALGCC